MNLLNKVEKNIKIFIERSQQKLTQMLNEEKNFLANTSTENLSQPTVASHAILIACGLFLIIAFFWASFATLDEVTVGIGKVISSRKTQVIQNLEGGIVQDILVHEGDVVEANQVLMHIDDTRFSSSYREAKLKELALTARVLRLEAEATGKPFALPQDGKFKDNPALLKNELDLYQSRQREEKVKLETLTKEKNQHQGELSALQAKLTQLQKSYALVEQELKMTKPLLKSGSASPVEILRLERQLNDLDGEIKATQFTIPKLQSTIEETQSKIEQLGATFNALVRDELNKSKAELEALAESNIALEDRYKRTAIRSPVKGTIKKMNVATIGGVIQPGMSVMEIVPLDDTLLIEARIRPSDVGFLHPGQKAMVKITAYDYSIYGGLEGTLEQISADTITDEKGESFYQIYVRTAKNYLGDQKKPLLIIPGMLASVDILTGKKTVMDYLLKPILKTKQNALRER